MSQDRPLIVAPLPASPPHVPTWVMPPACAEMEVATRLVPTSAEVRNMAGLSDIYVFLAPKGARMTAPLASGSMPSVLAGAGTVLCQNGTGAAARTIGAASV